MIPQMMITFLFPHIFLFDMIIFGRSYMSTSCESLRGSIFFPYCAHFGHRWPNARFLKGNEVLTKEIAVSGDTTGPCCMPQGKNSYEEVLTVIITRQGWLLPSMFNIKAISYLYIMLFFDFAPVDRQRSYLQKIMAKYHWIFLLRCLSNK